MDIRRSEGTSVAPLGVMPGLDPGIHALLSQHDARADITAKVAIASPDPACYFADR